MKDKYLIHEVFLSHEWTAIAALVHVCARAVPWI
jgi:hypothetical protein